MPTPQTLPESYRGPGLRVRFSRIAATKKGILAQPLYLPVTLGPFAVNEDFPHNEYDTVAAGQFSTPAPGGSASRQLRSPDDLQTLTIDWHLYARWLVNPKLSPENAKKFLTALARARTPFQIVATVPAVSGFVDEVRMHATIRAMRRELRPGERDTRYYTLTIKEWRDNSVERRSATGHGRHGSSLPTTVKLTAETTLVSLSKHWYPDVPVSVGWRAIAAANGVKSWGANTPLVRSKRFKVGDTFKIPAKPKVPHWISEQPDVFVGDGPLPFGSG